MTPKEIKTLVKALKAAGVTHYKTAELELNLATSQSFASPNVSRETKKAPKAQLPLLTHEEEKPIEHKVVELTSLLKLSDTDLVDRLFPDHTDYGDEEASA